MLDSETCFATQNMLLNTNCNTDDDDVTDRQTDTHTQTYCFIPKMLNSLVFLHNHISITDIIAQSADYVSSRLQQ